MGSYHGCPEKAIPSYNLLIHIIQSHLQPRPQGFSLKKWVGQEKDTHYLREKPWGRGCLIYSFGKVKLTVAE